MPLIADYPLSSTFSGVYQLQAAGIIDTGNNRPNGITNRLVIENGVLKATVSSDDDLTALGHRSEILHSAVSEGEYYYTWEMMIPQTWGHDDESISVMQIHDTPDGGDGARHPNFLLIVEDNQLVARVPVTVPTEDDAGQRLHICDLEKGTWYTFCLHVIWATDGTGSMSFFVNGVPAFPARLGATSYDDVTGPYLKLGVYDFFSELTGTVTAYYRNVKVYSGPESFNTVMGSPPTTPKNNLSI